MGVGRDDVREMEGIGGGIEVRELVKLMGGWRRECMIKGNGAVEKKGRREWEGWVSG